MILARLTRGVCLTSKACLAALGGVAAAALFPVSARAEADGHPRIAYQPVTFDVQAAAVPAPRVLASQEPDDEEPVPTIDYAVDIALVSDYRRGGTSLTDGKPAVQVVLSADHQSGLRASLWGSTVAANGGSDIEIDGAIGYRFNAGPIEIDLGATAYLFPGVPGSSYYELQAAFIKSIGDVELVAGLAYAPRQANTGNLDNIYAGLTFEWPLRDMPLTILGGIGVENGAFGDYKLDWNLGAEYDLGFMRLGASYIDAARTSGAPHSDATVAIMAARTF